MHPERPRCLLYLQLRCFPEAHPTEPIILLTEASTLYKDIIYGFDLLAHRIIKLNGLYCVTADFFRNAYRSGQLSNTIIYSETCEFLGVTNSVDESMAEALLAGGARTVLGYVNNVYTVYSRSMLWDTVNHLAMGQTIGRALAHAKDTYGENDIIWYTEQGGRRPTPPQRIWCSTVTRMPG